MVEASPLPSLVRGYAERVLPAEPLSGRTVKIQQVGEMVLKPGAAPRPFRASEEFAIDRVAFAWRASFPIVGPLGLHVTDSYDGRNGLLAVSLLGLPLQRRHGAGLARGEAFRYLAETPWAPQAILANPQLEWREIDSRTAALTTEVGDARIAVRLIFSEQGEIEQTLAARRRDEAGARLHPGSASTRTIGRSAVCASRLAVRCVGSCPTGHSRIGGPRSRRSSFVTKRCPLLGERAYVSHPRAACSRCLGSDGRPLAKRPGPALWSEHEDQLLRWLEDTSGTCRRDRQERR